MIPNIRFEDVITFDNLVRCGRECMKGVMWKSSTQMFKINFLQWMSSLYNDLMAEQYRSKGFKEFTITERGKVRDIQAVHISERCVQKTLCEYGLRPLIIPRLIYDNSASIPGKGTDFAINRLIHHLNSHFSKYGRNGGILIADFSNYFGSINHGILLIKLHEIIHDPKLFRLVRYFIEQFEGEVGIGLGSEISQICATFYLNDFDHIIKEHFHIEGYGRYNDDFYLIHHDIIHLRECYGYIQEMANILGLTLNTKRTKLINIDQTFSFLKKRFHLTENGKVDIRLPRKTLTKYNQKLKKQKQLFDNDDITIREISQSANSRMKFIEKFDTPSNVQKYSDLYDELYINDFISGKDYYEKWQK